MTAETLCSSYPIAALTVLYQIASSAAQSAQNHHAALRANLSATTTFHQHRPGAEKHFLEQNPWANPQHPAHHQQRLHRQVSGLSGAATRSSTPAGQRRVVDCAEPQGSASTIAEPHSGPNSSVAQTPATGEASKLVQSRRKNEMSESVADSTPSRVGNGNFLDSIPAHLALQDSSSGKAGNKNSPSLTRNIQIEHRTPGVLPKPLPFMHTGGSTPVRHPVIGAEDANVGSRHSPIPHQLHGATPISTSDGRVNRFAARIA